MPRQTLEAQENYFAETLDAVSPASRQVGGTHYEEMQIQPWDVIRTWPLAEQVGYHKGTALAYIMRAGRKGPALEDLQKAQDTLLELCDILQENA